MDITLDKKSAIEASIKITLKEDDYQLKVDEKLKDYAKKANIKGFRPGKVPVGMVKKMYGPSILVEEVNHMLSHALSDYIRDNDLNIIGEPLPNKEKAAGIKWESQKEFEFEYRVGLVDDFKYDLSKKQKVKKYLIEADDKVLDETIENILKQNGENSTPEVADVTDVVNGELTLTEGDFTTHAAIEIPKLMKKDQKNFKGLKKDDTISFDFKKTIKDKDWQTQVTGLQGEALDAIEGEMTLTVASITRTEPATIGQELFDKMFGKDTITSEEAFREKVKEEVEKDFLKQSDYFLDLEIRDHYLKKVKIELPEEFLKEWLLLANEGKFTAEQIEADFEKFTIGLKWDLIKNRVAKENDLKVENEDVTEIAKMQLAQQFGGNPAILDQLGDKLDEFVNQYLSNNNGENYRNAYAEALNTKTVSLIKEKIAISEETVSFEKFQKLVAN